VLVVVTHDWQGQIEKHPVKPGIEVVSQEQIFAHMLSALSIPKVLERGGHAEQLNATKAAVVGLSSGTT